MIQLVWLRGWSSLLCVVIVGVQVVVVTAGYPVAVDVVVDGSSNCQTTCQCYTDYDRRQLKESTTTTAPNEIAMRRGLILTRDLYRSEPHVTCTCYSYCSPTTYSSAQFIPNDSFQAHSYTHHGYMSHNHMYHDYDNVSRQYDDGHTNAGRNYPPANDDYSHNGPNYPQANDDYSYVDPNYPQVNDDYSYVDPNHQQANDEYAYDDYADVDHSYHGECCKYEEVCHYGGGGYGSKGKGMKGKRGMGKGGGKSNCRRVCVVPCNIPAPRPAPVDDPVTRPVPVPQPIRDDPVTRPVPVPQPIGDDPVSRPVPVPQPIADDPVFRPVFRQ